MSFLKFEVTEKQYKLANIDSWSMDGSPGELSEELVAGEAKEGLENEL